MLATSNDLSGWVLVLIAGYIAMWVAFWIMRRR
jgi:hypothetical protein